VALDGSGHLVECRCREFLMDGTVFFCVGCTTLIVIDWPGPQRINELQQIARIGKLTKPTLSNTRLAGRNGAVQLSH
jgi:hypothetical protein